LLYEQLAQHYGLETMWLDITSDFEVALFFACCKFDSYCNWWKPLDKIDFIKNNDTKFGVIFRRSASLPNSFIFHDPKYLQVLPIGFQPFMRCHMQYSYAIKMDEPSCLQDDESFEALRFKHSEKLCNQIYERMDRGKKIYPHEGLNIMKDEIDYIKTKKVFGEEVFKYASGEPQFRCYNKKLLHQLLIKYGYKIINGCDNFNKYKVELVNKQYSDFDIEKSYNIQLSTRLHFYNTPRYSYQRLR
jgi:hypothetical protein